MASVSTYLNFMGRTEEAFGFYAAAFGTGVTGPVMRMGDIPPAPGGPELSEADKALVMYMELTILGGHLLRGTDMVESMGHQLVVGNNVSITLDTDTREETDRLYAALSEGGSDTSPPADMFWGAYWGSVQDRYGIRWMFNCAEPGAA